MGYDPDFLAAPVAPPRAPDGGDLLDYTHFSLDLDPERRLASWVAWNIDGDRLHPGESIPRSGTRFRADPRVPDDHQTLDPVYADNRLDRGHVARRADLLWGPLDEALEANSDSFFFPNITPQMDDFNQERLGGSWGMLEAAILSEEGLRPRRLFSSEARCSPRTTRPTATSSASPASTGRSSSTASRGCCASAASC